MQQLQDAHKYLLKEKEWRKEEEEENLSIQAPGHRAAPEELQHQPNACSPCKPTERNVLENGHLCVMMGEHTEYTYGNCSHLYGTDLEKSEKSLSQGLSSQ